MSTVVLGVVALVALLLTPEVAVVVRAIERQGRGEQIVAAIFGVAWHVLKTGLYVYARDGEVPAAYADSDFQYAFEREGHREARGGRI